MTSRRITGAIRIIAGLALFVTIAIQIGDRVDYVVKFNGGNNAGHTVVVGDKKYALHLLPSGILSPGVTPVISNGVVVDIEVLFNELNALKSRGVDVSKLLISSNRSWMRMPTRLILSA